MVRAPLAGWRRVEVTDRRTKLDFAHLLRDMAVIETGVQFRQCLARRIPDRETLEREVAAWQARRNAAATPVDWRFRTEDARAKLKSLYPTIPC